MKHKDYKIIRNFYIVQLEKDLQTLIKIELIKYFKETLKLNDIEIEVEMAMNSRVSDLEDTINITETKILLIVLQNTLFQEKCSSFHLGNSIICC